MRIPLGVALFLLVCSSVCAAERYFGDEQIEIRIEADDERPGIYLQLNRIENDGKLRALIVPLRLALEGSDQSANKYVGSALALGQRVALSLTLASDQSSLQWHVPAELKLPEGGVLRLAGSHGARSVAERRKQAAEQFANADKRLNAAYGRIRERMAEEDFVELRRNQRLWLKYRDHFIADGDDVGINGPGSLPFLRQQLARTLDRATFLDKLAVARPDGEQLSGVYSDGIDRELRLRAIPTVDKHAFFSLSAALPGLHDSDYQLPLLVAGRASPDETGRSWTANDSVNANPLVGADSELLIEPAADFESLFLSSASSAVFTDRLYWVAALQPATEPMREILLRLPAEIFDNTTEGLSERDKTPLLLTGSYEPFQLQEQSADFARLRYSEGQVDVRRFAQVDGSALVAVETTNVRARAFELWRVPGNGAAGRRLNNAEKLPPLEAADFYSDQRKLGADGQLDLGLNPDTAEIRARWIVPPESPQPDLLIDLVWDGFGFAPVRAAVEG